MARRVPFYVVLMSLVLSGTFLAVAGAGGFQGTRRAEPKLSRIADSHYGDIIVRDGQSVTIHDAVLELNGSVVVKDSGRLTLLNVTLSIAQSLQSDNGIRVEGQGRIDVLDSHVVSSDRLWFDVFDAGTAFVNNSVLDTTAFHLRGSPVLIVSRSVFQELLTGDTARINVYYSTILRGITFEYVSPITAVQLAGLRPGYYPAFNFWPYPTMHMLHVEVGGWSFLVHQKALVTVNDSTLDRFTVLFENMDAVVDGWLPGYVDEWRLRFLALWNSTIREGWGVTATNADIRVSNSQVTIGPYATGLSRITVSDSVVDGVFLKGYHGSLQFQNVTLRGAVQVEESTGQFTGDFSVEQANLTRFRDSSVARIFQVRAYDTTGQELPGVLVRLVQDEVTVSSGTTGASGVVALNHVFTDLNVDGVLTLELSVGGVHRSARVDFLTGSPIDFILDVIPPSITISSPANGSTVAGTVAVDVEASDNVGVTKVEFTLDDVSLMNFTAGPYHYDLDTGMLTNGQHVLTALAHDGDGNVGSASTVFIVNNIPPTPTPSPTETPSTTQPTTTTTSFTTTSPPPVEIGFQPLIAGAFALAAVLLIRHRRVVAGNVYLDE